MTQLRQGDLIITKIDELPSGLVKHSPVLLEGEVTDRNCYYGINCSFK